MKLGNEILFIIISIYYFITISIVISYCPVRIIERIIYYNFISHLLLRKPSTCMTVVTGLYFCEVVGVVSYFIKIMIQACTFIHPFVMPSNAHLQVTFNCVYVAVYGRLWREPLGEMLISTTR